MELTKENTLAIPNEIFGKAPTCFDDKKNRWFEKETEDWDFYVNCERALIAMGIGEHECPTIAEWAGFSIAGGIIAALSGKYIISPEKESSNWHDWRNNMSCHIWKTLWWASQKNPEKLDRAFLAAILKDFLPRQHYAAPERPYSMSNFENHWGRFEYADTSMHSTGNLRLGSLKKGREVFASLPEPVKASIQAVAQHIPAMLEIAIKRIRKTYHW